jgi:hypothetical protein
MLKMSLRRPAKCKLCIFTFVTLFSAQTMAALAPHGNWVEAVQSCANEGDDLGTRTLTLRAAKAELTGSQWRAIRTVLHSHPGVGWDLIRMWDLVQKSEGAGPKAPLNQKIAEADELMSYGNFARSTSSYSAIAKSLRAQQVRFGQSNFFVYQSLMHSLARSLYGEGRYAESTEVYEWISTLYPFLRQVQFEKMWAGFRANNVSLALGAIASQRSSYFSPFLEPESYLIQYYLYRRLCRKKDMVQVLNEVRHFKEILDHKKFTLEMWARRDIETISMLRLTKPTSESCAAADTSEKENQILKIKENLTARYRNDLPRIESQMEKVVAYLNLAPEATKKDLPPIGEIMGLQKLLSSATEMWPVDDAEDWLDELGHHRFIGKSECQ